MAKKEVTFIVVLFSGEKVKIITVGGDPLMHLINVLPPTYPLKDSCQSFIVLYDTQQLFDVGDFKDFVTLNSPMFKEEVKKMLNNYTGSLKPKPKSIISSPFVGSQLSSILKKNSNNQKDKAPAKKCTFEKDANEGDMYAAAKALKKVQGKMKLIGSSTMNNIKGNALETNFAKQKDYKDFELVEMEPMEVLKYLTDMDLPNPQMMSPPQFLPIPNKKTKTNPKKKALYQPSNHELHNLFLDEDDSYLDALQFLSAPNLYEGQIPATGPLFPSSVETNSDSTSLEDAEDDFIVKKFVQNLFKNKL